VQKSYSYAYENFLLAVDIMATAKDTRPKRLGYAFAGSLMWLKPNDLPKEIQQEFKNFSDAMTSKEEEWRGQGQIDATTRTMHWRTAKRLAESLFHMFIVVTETHLEGDELAARERRGMARLG